MPSVQRGFETPCVAAPSGGSGAGTCSNRALLLAKAPAKAAAAPKGGRFSLDQNVLWHLLKLISLSAESRSTSCLFCCKYSLVSSKRASSPVYPSKPGKPRAELIAADQASSVSHSLSSLWKPAGLVNGEKSSNIPRKLIETSGR